MFRTSKGKLDKYRHVVFNPHFNENLNHTPHTYMLIFLPTSQGDPWQKLHSLHGKVVSLVCHG